MGFRESSHPEVRWGRIAFAAAALACGALAVVATMPHVGVTVDSAEYLAVAETVASGDGLSMPYLSYDEPYQDREDLGERVEMTQFPPLYPTTLGVVSRLTGWSVEGAAPFVGAVAYAAAAVLLLALLRHHGGSEPLGWRHPSLWVALLLFATHDFTAAFATAWSEQFLVVPLLAQVAVVLAYQQRPRAHLVVSMAAVAALATTARFLGIAVGLGAAALLWTGTTGSPRRRRTDAAIVAFAGLLPAALWALRNRSVLGSLSEKSLGFHPFLPGDLGKALLAALGWFPGGPITSIPAVVLAWWTYRQARRDGSASWPLLRALLAMAGACLAVLVLSRSFLDANISFDERQLLAVEFAVIVGVALGLPQLARTCAPLADLRRRRGLAAVGAAAFLAHSVAFAFTFSGTERSGYVADRWLDSELLADVRDLPPGSTVITNSPDAVQMHTDADTLFIPLEHDLYTDSSNRSFPAQLADLAAHTTELRATGRTVALAFFYRPTRGGHRPLPAAVRDAFDLQEVTITKEGELHLLTG